MSAPPDRPPTPAAERPLPAAARHEALIALLRGAPPTSSLRRAARLLSRPEPDRHVARLDTALGLLRGHRRRIAAALAALDGEALDAVMSLDPGALSEATQPAGPSRAFLGDPAVDALMRALAEGCADPASTASDDPPRAELPAPIAALIELVHAVARLGEDAAGLEDRHRRSPGIGFEDLHDRRLHGRLPRLLDAPRLVAELDARLPRLAREPDAGLAARLGPDPRAEADARAWIEAERRAAILRFVRHDKTDGEGHIRRHVEVDERGRPVLVRLGVRGWWRAPRGELELGLKQAAAIEDGRLDSAEAAPLRRLSPEGPDDLHRQDLAPTLAAPHWNATSDSIAEFRLEVGRDERALEGLQLRRRDRLVFPSPDVTEARPGPGRAPDDREDGSEPARVESGAALDLLKRVEALGRRCRVSAAAARTALGGLCRALQRRLEDDAARRVRLVYVPSELPHPLGGVPELGLAILDRVLSERGDRVLRLMIRAREFDDRLAELLTADVVGVGVYVHNRAEVARLVRRLRAAGFAGLIVLGGPECRSIEAILRDFDGFDAVIRGEAEDVLPAVLETLDLIRRGELTEAARRALALRGVVLRVADELWLCDTAHRSRAAVVRAPRPLLWSADGRLKLKVNVSRGCPYLCTFCPNHQGRAFRAGPVEELVEVLIDAVADHRRLPAELRDELHHRLRRELDVPETGIRLPLSALVHVAARLPLSPELQRDLEAVARRPGVDALPERPSRPSEDPGFAPGGFGGFAEAWLNLKRRHGLAGSAPRFVIETSEDNTLVNRATVLALLARRRELGLAAEVLFNPGQNTIRDLLGPDGAPDEAFLDALVRDNPFEVAFGTDATSPAVLRQNRKPNASISQVLAVNRALARRGIRAVNNTILLSAETTLLEAIESLLLWRLLPLPWRDYGPAINLRVIKEETTLATDEGRLLQPDDTGWDVPLRDPETVALIERLGLSAMMTAADAAQRIETALVTDDELRAHLPRLLERWTLDLDDEPELRALADLVRQEQSRTDPALDLGEAVLSLIRRLRREALDELGTRRTPSEVLRASEGSTRDISSV